MSLSNLFPSPSIRNASKIAPAAAVDPEVPFHFLVTVDNFFFGDFKSVSDVALEVPVDEYNEGGRNDTPLYMPFKGPKKNGQVKLEWGSPVWTVLYDWMSSVEVGGSYRKEVFVYQLGREGVPSRIFRFARAWPVSWNRGGLDTSKNEWQMESLTLVYESLNIVTTRAQLLMRL